MTTWQIAAGSGGRDYTELFLLYGIAFVGGDRQCDTLDNGVQLGDTLILKWGTSYISAVGTVVERNGRFKGRGDKAWLLDVDGWELPSWCYVDWHVPPGKVSTSQLTRATIQGVSAAAPLAAATQILGMSLVPQAPLAEPSPTAPISDDELISYLIRSGLRVSAAEDLAIAFRRIRHLARFYRSGSETTNEHDVRTFLVVPLLLALGWTEQRLKLEMHVPGVGRSDIACFDRAVSNRTAASCVGLIETKNLDQGLDYAPDQARSYAKAASACELVVVTNGYAYKTYSRCLDGSFPSKPTSFLNVLSPTDRYPLDPLNVSGALEAISALLPI